MGGPEIMNEITFITGNQGKADFLAKHLGVEVGHQKLDLDEIQSLVGTIAQSPVGENGFGFDPIVIPHGHDKTLAQMSDEELKENSLRTTTVYPKIKEFLQDL
jgi:inosine/xanthosine triphosphate pyrophosphatase family protein